MNVAYKWTEKNDPGQWNGGSGTLSPRLGFALRIDDNTSVRAGWGRHVSPFALSSNATQGNYYGYSLQTAPPSPVLGIPQMSLVDPFPVNSYPIQPVLGKSLGAYTGLGDSLSWFAQDRPRQYVNRINISLQRQVAFGLVADATYFINSFTNPSARNINAMDPRISYTYKAAINPSVPNPFYQILPANNLPGPLRNQRTGNLTSLMVSYPQYGSLSVTDYENNSRTLFQQFAIRVRKSYGYGLTFLGGYAYTHSKTQVYYDDIAAYLRQRTWEPDPPPSYYLRPHLGAASRPRAPVPAELSTRARRGRRRLERESGDHVARGDLLSFPGLIVNGDPHIDDPVRRAGSIRRFFRGCRRTRPARIL